MNRLALLAFAAGLAACATTAPVPEPAAPVRSPCDYYPLAVGNRWVYDVYQGAPGAGAPHEELPVTVTGTRDGFFLVDPNAQWVCTADGLRDEKRSLLRAPIEQGHKWSAVTGVGSTEHIEITGVGQEVVVPAGTFSETVTVQATQRIDASKSIALEMTFARHIGPIRLQTKLIDGGREIPQITTQLRSFEPAPAASGPAKP
jgi:hypothetical protein